MHEEIIGAGVANLFIERMKLEGWLPIKEYFKMEKLGIELDWVLVLTMENDGFIAIPMVAEYLVPHKYSGRKSGWYKDDIDNPNRRIDDWTNVIMFKLLDKPYIDEIRDLFLTNIKSLKVLQILMLIICLSMRRLLNNVRELNDYSV